MAADNDNSQLKTGVNEPVKQYCVYNGDGLLTELYEARANAEDGDKCMLTEYTYVTGTTRIEKTRESISEWDSTWDID